MRRRARTGSRGAVAIEAALVTPLLLIIVFGIIEMAFLMKDDVALTSLVRQGGRTASSALADHHEQSHNPSEYCVAPTCSVENAPELADVTAMAIQRAGAALPKDSIDVLWIYKADADGYPAGNSGSDHFASCSTDCVVYKWSSTDGAFDYVSGTWLADDINACTGSDLDTVGVYMRATHSFLTGLFSNGVDITDHAVFAFEPLEPTICAERLS